MSLLVGRATPFLWKDTLTDGNRLTRLYMMGHGRRHSITGGEQPFPLGRSTEMFKHGRDFIRQLPAMFARFVELARHTTPSGSRARSGTPTTATSMTSLPWRASASNGWRRHTVAIGRRVTASVERSRFSIRRHTMPFGRR